MIEIRNYNVSDEDEIGRLAVEAFFEYRRLYDNWDDVYNKMLHFVSLNPKAEIVIADHMGKLAGFVAYIAGNVPKQGHFPNEHPIISGLSVRLAYRGKGIGKKLVQQCINRAINENSKYILLHTSDVMKNAVAIYLKFGFKKYKKPYLRNGLVYQMYIKKLA